MFTIIAFEITILKINNNYLSQEMKLIIKSNKKNFCKNY